jgi:hypothetical protein
MRSKAGVLLACVAFAVPILAQTKAEPAKPEGTTEKLWKIEVAGISG